MKAYRKKYPDAPPWQNLHDDTKFRWIDHMKTTVTHGHDKL